MRNYFFDEISKLKKETTVSGDISSTETPLKKKNSDEDNDEEEESNE